MMLVTLLGAIGIFKAPNKNALNGVPDNKFKKMLTLLEEITLEKERVGMV